MSNSAASYSRASADNNAKVLLIGALIAMIAYGIALVLVGINVHNFIQLEAQNQATRDRNPYTAEKRSRHFVLFYTIVMFCLSTLACIAGTPRAYNAVFPHSDGTKPAQSAFSLLGDAIGIVFASWCADALMLWRCLVIYKKASSFWRACLIVLLSALYATYVATGLAFIITCLKSSGGFMVAFAAASAALNATITIFIVARIWRQQKYIESALGRGFTATYTHLIHLFVESAALIVVFHLGHVILTQWSNRKYILAHALLAHVNVISTL